MKRVHVKNVPALATVVVGSAPLRANAGKTQKSITKLIADSGRGQTSESKSAVSRPQSAVSHEQSTIMNSEKAIVLEGTIMMVLPGTMFRVALANERMVLAHISGKMRKRFIRLTIGDRVKMEMSPYDTAKARIVYRL
jgi:translation initiation factor IF-1